MHGNCVRCCSTPIAHIVQSNCVPCSSLANQISHMQLFIRLHSVVRFSSFFGFKQPHRMIINSYRLFHLSRRAEGNGFRWHYFILSWFIWAFFTQPTLAWSFSVATTNIYVVRFYFIFFCSCEALQCYQTRDNRRRFTEWPLRRERNLSVISSDDIWTREWENMYNLVVCRDCVCSPNLVTVVCLFVWSEETHLPKFQCEWIWCGWRTAMKHASLHWCFEFDQHNWIRVS